MTTTNLFKDFHVKVEISGQPQLTSDQKKAVQGYYKERSQVYRQFHCAVAESVNEAFGGTYDKNRHKLTQRAVLDFGEAGRYVLDDSCRARLGTDMNGELYLKVGLTGETEDDKAERYRLTWRGQNVPELMARIAVAHDKGEAHDWAKINLELGEAELTVAPKKLKDTRPPRNPEKDGGRKVRGVRNHHRPCLGDLKKLYG